MASTERMLDFGELPVSISPAAGAALAKLPKKALQRTLQALAAWSERAPIDAAKATYYTDYEDQDLRYVLLQFRLKAMEPMEPDDEAELDLRLNADLARVYTEALDAAGERDRKRLAAGLTVSITWPDDWDYTWGDDSASEA